MVMYQQQLPHDSLCLTVVFNTRNPVQVVVERGQYSTSMTVYTQGALFNASVDTDLLMIQEDEYEQLPFGDSKPVPEMVYYPHSVTRPYPFHQVKLWLITLPLSLASFSCLSIILL